MAKIFISYKYRDRLVKQIPGVVVEELGATTPRNYVDDLDTQLKQLGHICKAEDSGEDMSEFSPETIATKLADRLYDSTVTVVLISKGMDNGTPEKKQWIPWEISYSLTENARGGRTSATNAMIAVVLPDESDSYNYFVTDHNCWLCSARTWYKNNTFKILGLNMFNRHKPKLTNCDNPSCDKTNIHTGEDHSYIHPVKWEDFKSDINHYIDLALNR